MQDGVSRCGQNELHLCGSRRSEENVYHCHLTIRAARFQSCPSADVLGVCLLKHQHKHQRGLWFNLHYKKCFTDLEWWLFFKLISENGYWWAWLWRTLDTGLVQCVALIRSLQGFSHFQPYYWILSQYTGRMKLVLRIDFNVRCLYLGTGNHCTVVEQIKGSEAEKESVLQHLSLVSVKDLRNCISFIVRNVLWDKAEQRLQV